MNHVFVLTVIASFWACGNAGSQSAEDNEGKEIFKTYCVACHGADGKLKLNDAPDLTFSTMTLEERIKNISEGGSMMPAFAEVISEEQIKIVAVYLDELKEQN